MDDSDSGVGREALRAELEGREGDARIPLWADNEGERAGTAKADWELGDDGTVRALRETVSHFSSLSRVGAADVGTDRVESGSEAN